MTVTLVDPNLLNPLESHGMDKRDSVVRGIGPSLSMGRLTSSLNGHEVQVVDHLTEYLRDDGEGASLLERGKKIFPESDVIGVSIMSSTRRASFNLIRLANEISDATIVAGGPHATLLPGQVVGNYPVDVVSIGESEMTLPEIVGYVEGNRSLKSITGIAFEDDGEIVSTEPRGYADLDVLPLPDYYPYFDLDSGNELKTASVLTSRGCPYYCKFCTKYWGDVVRERSIGNVIEEIGYLTDNGIENIRFQDDILTSNQDRAKKLFSTIAGNFDVSLHMITRFGTFDEELLEKFKEAGGESVYAAIETGSEDLRRKMNKPISNKTIRNDVERLEEHGLGLYLYVMLGFPGERESDLKKTKEMLRDLEPDGVTCSIYHANPGSEVYRWEKDQGMIKDKNFLQTDKMKFYYFDGKELEERRRYQREILDEFGAPGRMDARGMVSDKGRSYDDFD